MVTKNHQPSKGHQAPSPRASSAREEPTHAAARGHTGDAKAQDERHERSAARPDPSHLPPEKRVPDTADTSHETSPYAKANPPQPQQGMSSSELNSLPGAVKDKMIQDQEGPDQKPEKE